MKIAIQSVKKVQSLSPDVQLPVAEEERKCEDRESINQCNTSHNPDDDDDYTQNIFFLAFVSAENLQRDLSIIDSKKYYDSENFKNYSTSIKPFRGIEK